MSHVRGGPIFRREQSYLEDNTRASASLTTLATGVEEQRGGFVPPEKTETRGLAGSAPGVDAPSAPQRPVKVRVPIESKLGLWPSEPQLEKRHLVEPAPAKRARRRRG